MGGLRWLKGVTAADGTACVFDPRRLLLACLSGFISFGHCGAVHGQVHGLGRAGVAGCFSEHGRSVRKQGSVVSNNIVLDV